MGTFDDKTIIDKLIANDGYYPSEPAFPGEPEDPRVVRIVEYHNMAGKKCWGVVYEPEVAMGMLYRYDYETEYIHNPVVIFDASSSRTTS